MSKVRQLTRHYLGIATRWLILPQAIWDPHPPPMWPQALAISPE